MKNIHIEYFMKFLLLCALCGSSCLVKGQNMKLDDINFDIPGMAISKVKLKSGGSATSFKIIPRSIDSYSEQKIVGIVAVTDVNGNVSRVDPVLHEAELPDLSEIVTALEGNMSIQSLCDKYQFADLTEVQRMGFLRKFAIALIVYEGDVIRVDLNPNTKELINKSLTKFEIKIENAAPVEAMRKWARLIIRKVKFE